jgi:hypothetical protein
MTHTQPLLAVVVTLAIGSSLWAHAKEEPAAEAPKSPLEATLVANEDTYTLDKNQQGEVFAKSLQEIKNAAPPDPPVVDFVFEIKNPTDKDVTIILGADSGSLDLILKGPGAVTIPGQRIFTREFRAGKPVTIAAGETHKIPIKQLKFGFRGVGTFAYWTEPGEYTLAAKLSNRGEPALLLETAPIKITVKGAE